MLVSSFDDNVSAVSLLTTRQIIMQQPTEETQSFFRNRAHHIRLVTFLLFLFTVAQLVYNVILVVHFDTTMGVFQASWVHFSIIALVSLFVVFGFGLFAIASKTDRQASIYKSWILFFASTIFFCGFFHVIAFVKDAHLFYAQCSRGFHGPKDNHEIEPDETAAHSHEYCRKLNDKLLVSWILLWLAHTTLSFLLFMVIRWYRKATFESESKLDNADGEERGRARDRKDTLLKAPKIVVHSAPEE